MKHDWMDLPLASFDKDICELKGIRVNMKNLYLAQFNLLSDKVNVHFSVFGSLMLHWITREIQHWCYHNEPPMLWLRDNLASSKKIMQLTSFCFSFIKIKKVYAIVFSMLLCYASTLKQDTVGCGFEDKGTKLTPR